MKTWRGRLESTDPFFEAFTSSTAQDQRLLPYDIRVSQAHARTLARAGLLTAEEAERIASTLDEIEGEAERGEFVWRDDLEDVHTHVESRLREKLGELGERLHAGRSRNDQIAADLRLYVIDAARQVQTGILDVQTSLLGLAERNRSAVMPAYTHLQQAQPVLVGLPFLAYASMLSRDWERFHNSLSGADRSPLGSGAIAGTTFPLDRQYLAEQAGFTKVIGNSMDAVADRDFLLEYLSSTAICMSHLSRLAEDLILWSSVEFGFVGFSDTFASGSSMMPQKKNPDVAELIRAKAALVIGDLTGGLALMKGLPGGYNRDLQEAQTPLFHASDSVLACLQILAPLLDGLKLDEGRMQSSVSSFSLATDLADHLVRQGLPFREAHGVVGQLVARCLSEGRSLDQLSADELLDVSEHFQGFATPTPSSSIHSKRTAGSTHPEEVAKLLRELRDEIVERREAS